MHDTKLIVDFCFGHNSFYAYFKSLQSVVLVTGYLFEHKTSLSVSSNLSNTRDSVSSGYPNTEKRVQNTTHCQDQYLTQAKAECSIYFSSTNVEKVRSTAKLSCVIRPTQRSLISEQKFLWVDGEKSLYEEQPGCSDGEQNLWLKEAQLFPLVISMCLFY